jgi:regulator of nonsense transcripts 1
LAAGATHAAAAAASVPATPGGEKWTSADVNFSPSASESLRLTVGDELLIRMSKRLLPGTYKADWEAKATVVRVGEPGEPTTVEVRTSTKPPLDVREGYSVSFVWKPITFDRMQLAMKHFATDPSAVSNFLYRKILGHDADELQASYQLGGGVPPERSGYLSAPGLPDLNPSQQAAVQQVLSRPLALIQGPPGTGKTVTLATLVYHMVAKEHRRVGGASAREKKGKGQQQQQKGGKTGAKGANAASEMSHSPVLVCAPSNVAVDHLAERIHQTGVKVLRLSAKSREHIDSKVEHLTLHNMISLLEEGEATTSGNGTLSSGKGKKGRRISSENTKKRKKLEYELIREADVVCCTCSGAGDPRLDGMRFRRVLIDEATQATEPESLIPIVLGCEQFILVGDHCQLGPVVMSKRAANAGLNSSLFERLVTLGLRPVRLQVQYRMHPCLSEWPSNTFYEGSLQNGVTANDRSNDGIDFPWIDPDRPMMFYSCQGSEEIAATGTSFLNRTEATACEKVVTTLVRGGVSPSQVGVITPYEGQRAFIVQQLHHFGPLKSSQYQEVEVSSVDAFQGREKEYIVVSCVRSNEKQGIGFLNDPRRLNVALTRAKRGLIVLGNPRVLAKRPLWNDLLVHFRERGLLVEGALANLQPSMMRFPNAKKYYRDPRQRFFEELAAPVFSGDLSNPYGDAVVQPPTGFGFGDFDYGTSLMTGAGQATQLTQQSQQSQSTTGGFYYHRNGGPSMDYLNSKILTEGPATQLSQSQRTQTTQASQN